MKTPHASSGSTAWILTGPLLVQVSRFDPWKDPLGVIDVYRAVKRRVPGRAACAWSARWRMTTLRAWNTTSAPRTTPTATPISTCSRTSMASATSRSTPFQRMAAVVLQKSLREGFGLTISEGLWKGKPVIGGNVGGIPLQIQDGVTGLSGQ